MSSQQPNSVFILEVSSGNDKAVLADCCFTTRKEAQAFKDLQVERIRDACDIMELACFNEASEVPKAWYRYPEKPIQSLSNASKQ